MQFSIHLPPHACGTIRGCTNTRHFEHQPTAAAANSLSSQTAMLHLHSVIRALVWFKHAFSSLIRPVLSLSRSLSLSLSLSL